MFRRLKAKARWLGYRSFPGAVILRYHRVTELPSDAHATAVSPANFSEQLEVLRAHLQPLSLRSLVRSLTQEGPPRLGVVITLDDGYADNLYQAKPVLERFEMPATVFVTTGAVDGGREFWWDELERVLLHPGTLPREMRIESDGISFAADLGEQATYGEGEFERDRSWSWRSEDDPTARHAAFRRLARFLRDLDAGERSATMDAVLEWAALPKTLRPTHATLSSDELKELTDGGLIEVGAHSVSHSALSRLSAEARRREIEGSRAFLEEATGEAVTGFAYPYGDVGDAAGLVREAGFESGCTTRSGVVFRGRDPFRLPRVYVGDWNGDEFERRLRTLP